MRRIDVRMVPIVVLLAVAASACAHGSGRYTWVNDLPPDPPSALEYRFHVGDGVNIRVFGQEAMGTKTRVRTDGKIAFPILGEIEVRGKRPAEVARELETKLVEYVVTPHVTVSVEEVQPLSVSVLGEVAKPGIFSLEYQSGVAQAIAAASGITDFASKDSIYVVRGGQRIRFTLEAVSRGEGRAGSFALQSGDLVVVE
jgi:polysaccharide export outer membrane protein